MLIYYFFQKPLMSLSGDKGPKWIFLTIPIPNDLVNGPFQLVILVRRGSSYLSDVDLNYVELISNDSTKCQRLIKATSIIEEPMVKNEMVEYFTQHLN